MVKIFRWKKNPEEKPELFQVVILWPQIAKAEYIDGFFLSLNGGTAYMNVEWWIEKQALPGPLSSRSFTVSNEALGEVE